MTRYIITDSTAYLGEEYFLSYPVKKVPLYVNLEGDVFKEGEKYSNKEYYEIMRSKPLYPQTSQPAAGEFLTCFESLNDEDEALVLLISGGISGTIQSAQMARDMLGANADRIHILETNITAGGLMLIVDWARQRLEEGTPTEQVLKELEDISKRVKLFFVVDNLEYLVRGGRVGHWSRVLANTLKLKPVLHFEKGKIELYQKIRTKHKALDHIVDLVAAELPHINRLSVMYVDNASEAEQLSERIKEFYPGEIMLCGLGPVIGSHVGPGTLGIAWF